MCLFIRGFMKHASPHLDFGEVWHGLSHKPPLTGLVVWHLLPHLPLHSLPGQSQPLGGQLRTHGPSEVGVGALAGHTVQAIILDDVGIEGVGLELVPARVKELQWKVIFPNFNCTNFGVH